MPNFRWLQSAAASTAALPRRWPAIGRRCASSGRAHSCFGGARGSLPGGRHRLRLGDAQARNPLRPQRLGEAAGVRRRGRSLSRATGSRSARTAAGSAYLEDEPAWSPNGKQIAFTRNLCTEASECFGASEIFVANSDGSGSRELTFPSTGELRSAHPSWSPDSRRIAFASEMDVYSKLAIIDVASGKYEPLGLSGTEPTWGKHGIAYLAQKVSRVKNLGKPRNSIRIVDPNTHRRRPFASPPVGYTVLSIAWSVRGELASFATHHGYAHPAKATIYSNAGRQLSEFVVPKKWRVCGLTWSPRGDRLLFTVVPAGKGVNPGVFPQLYTVDSDGKRWHHIQLGLGLTSCSVSAERTVIGCPSSLRGRPRAGVAECRRGRCSPASASPGWRTTGI